MYMQLLESSIEKPLSRYRFIDDVDMKWTQSDEELLNFLSRANNLHPSIKFTHEISNTTISFLDTSSSLSEGVLSTDLYSKPTDTNQYLLPSSCHPPHVAKSIPYSQALRIRRICSTDKSLKKRLGQLKNNLKRRGYKQSIIKKSRRGVWGPLKVSSGSRAKPWLGGPGGKPRKLLGFAYLGSFSVINFEAFCECDEVY